MQVQDRAEIDDAVRGDATGLRRFVRRVVCGLWVLSTVFLTSCTTVVTSITTTMADNLSSAVLNNDDPEMVRSGAPAYLLLMDSLLVQSPDDPDLLAMAATLNNAYAAAFVAEPGRLRGMADKALGYSERAVCAALDDACDLRRRPYPEFEAWLADRPAKQVRWLYGLGSSWAGWIQANASDWAAIAELGRVKAIMERIIELDEGYDYGGAHLYLGVFETLLPAAMGGRPEVGKAHFERAIELSQGRHLLTKVLYARQYARLVYDRELHDELLEQVLASDPEVDNLTLINLVAQEQARELLDEADDYF